MESANNSDMGRSNVEPCNVNVIQTCNACKVDGVPGTWITRSTLLLNGIKISMHKYQDNFLLWEWTAIFSCGVFSCQHKLSTVSIIAVYCKHVIKRRLRKSLYNEMNKLWWTNHVKRYKPRWDLQIKLTDLSTTTQQLLSLCWPSIHMSRQSNYMSSANDQW